MREKSFYIEEISILLKDCDVDTILAINHILRRMKGDKNGSKKLNH